MSAPAIRYFRGRTLVASAVLLLLIDANAVLCKHRGRGTRPATTSCGSGTNAKNTLLTKAIATMWDGKPVRHDPITVTLTGKRDHLDVSFKSPFFDRDAKPDCKPKMPCPKSLAEYEAIEFIFLSEACSTPYFIRIIVNPYGVHNVFLHKGTTGKDVLQWLPSEFISTTRETSKGKVWTGTVKVPVGYFPPFVTKWNAFAVRKDRVSPGGRAHEALFPAPSGKHKKPDSHRFQYYQRIPFQNVFPAYRPSTPSNDWKKAVAGKGLSTCSGRTNGVGSYAAAPAVPETGSGGGGGGGDAGDSTTSATEDPSATGTGATETAGTDAITESTGTGETTTEETTTAAE